VAELPDRYPRRPWQELKVVTGRFEVEVPGLMRVRVWCCKSCRRGGQSRDCGCEDLHG